MKTKVLVFAGLLIGGLIFSSCQKDNALYEDDAFAKTEFVSEVDTISPDPIRNYPDPFLNTTVVEYRLEKTSYVRLSVYNEETGYIRLMNEGIQVKGLHAMKFEAYNLPNGEYIAQLEIGNKTFTEVMTKKGFRTAKDIQGESPDE